MRLERARNYLILKGYQGMGVASPISKTLELLGSVFPDHYDTHVMGRHSRHTHYDIAIIGHDIDVAIEVAVYMD
jgi:hypothetical protein